MRSIHPLSASSRYSGHVKSRGSVLYTAGVGCLISEPPSCIQKTLYFQSQDAGQMVTLPGLLA